METKKLSLRSVLLALLSRQPNTGYGIGRLLRGELAHLWEASLQQIYSELGRLERSGLVEMEQVAMPNRPVKKVYSLTLAGAQALDSWLSRSPALPNAKDEFLVQLYCFDRLPSATIVRRLEQRRDLSLSRAALARGQVLKTPRTEAANLGELLTLEASRIQAEADVSWCERALATLEEAPHAGGDLTANGPAREPRRASA